MNILGLSLIGILVYFFGEAVYKKSLLISVWDKYDVSRTRVSFVHVPLNAVLNHYKLVSDIYG